MILKLGDKEVDLAKAFPMTIGDFKALEGLGVLNEKGDMDTASPTKMVSFLFHLLHKADESVTEAEVENISLDDLDGIGDFFDLKMKETKVDRPT